VIAGAIGSSQTLQYTVIGDAVNVAARLCSVALASEIIVSQSTMSAASEYVISEQREPVRVKGKAQPLPIFNVTGMQDVAAPYQVGARPTAPFRTTQS
jgi:adenylate cyclase